MNKKLEKIDFCGLIMRINEMRNGEKRNDYIYLGMSMIEEYLLENGVNYKLKNAVLYFKQSIKRELEVEYLRVYGEGMNCISNYWWTGME